MKRIKFQKIKKYIPIILLLGILCSCEDKYEADECESFFWSPFVKVEKGDEKATLYLIDPRPFATYICGPPNPDYFNILISEDLQNFTLYQKVDFTTSSVVIENLVNEKPYYFLVTTHKENLNHIDYDTVMTVPSKETVLEPYMNINDHSLKRFSTSYDKTYVTFQFANNTLIEGFERNTLYYKKNESGTILQIEKDAYNENWSPRSNKLVYLNTIVEGITLYPNEVKVLDFETMASKVLFEVQYKDYNVIHPDFTSEGDMITYLSDENSYIRYLYDLWEINPITKEKLKLQILEISIFT